MDTANKSFGTDEQSGLEKEIRIFGFNFDVKNSSISFFYDINLISNGSKIRVYGGAFSKYVDNIDSLSTLSEINDIAQAAFNNIQSFETYQRDIQ